MLWPGEELAIQAARGGELAWMMWWTAVLAAVGVKGSGVERHQTELFGVAADMTSRVVIVSEAADPGNCFFCGGRLPAAQNALEGDWKGGGGGGHCAALLHLAAPVLGQQM